MTFCTYIQTERVRKLIIISLILNEFSCGKVQIHYRFCSKSLDKSHFHARYIYILFFFLQKFEQIMNCFARGCVKNLQAQH